MAKKIFLMLTMLLALNSLSAQETSLSREAERSQRGLTSYKNTFINKGQWAVGASASYSAHSNENYNLVVLDNINSLGYNFDISTMCTYAFAPNNSVGARVSYDRSLLKVDSSNITFGEDINLSMDNCYMLSHSYSVMAIMRQYIPIGSSKRFALFNEVQLEGCGSQSKFTYDSPIQGTYSKSREYALNFAPGISAFITNKVALEINVGAMGISYTKVDQVHNQVETGEMKNNLFNFKVNILSMGFGVTYYL